MGERKMRNNTSLLVDSQQYSLESIANIKEYDDVFLTNVVKHKN